MDRYRSFGHNINSLLTMWSWLWIWGSLFLLQGIILLLLCGVAVFLNYLIFLFFCWYFVMKLSSLQGDYNGEEIAKVMELVELEEAEKKRQGGWADLLGWKQNRFRCHLPSQELLYQSKGLTCGMCRIGLECVTEWCWPQSGISTPTATAPQPPLALATETRS